MVQELDQGERTRGHGSSSNVAHSPCATHHETSATRATRGDGGVVAPARRDGAEPESRRRPRRSPSQPRTVDHHDSPSPQFGTSPTRRAREQLHIMLAILSLTLLSSKPVQGPTRATSRPATTSSRVCRSASASTTSCPITRWSTSCSTPSRPHEHQPAEYPPDSTMLAVSRLRPPRRRGAGGDGEPGLRQSNAPWYPHSPRPGSSTRLRRMPRRVS